MFSRERFYKRKRKKAPCYNRSKFIKTATFSSSPSCGHIINYDLSSLGHPTSSIPVTTPFFASTLTSLGVNCKDFLAILAIFLTTQQSPFNSYGQLVLGPVLATYTISCSCLLKSSGLKVKNTPNSCLYICQSASTLQQRLSPTNSATPSARLLLVLIFSLQI